MAIEFDEFGPQKILEFYNVKVGMRGFAMNHESYNQNSFNSV